MRFLPPNVAAIVGACAKHNTKYAITGVHYRELPKDRYEVTATDTRILARITGTQEFASADHPCTPFLEASPNGGTSALIEAKSFAAWLKGAAKNSKYKPMLNHTGIVISEGESPSITVASTDLDSERKTSSMVLEGRFPPIEEMLEYTLGAEEPIIKIKLSAARLIDLLKCAAAVNDTVEFRFFADKPNYEGKRLVLLKTKSEQGPQKFLGAIQPLS